MKIKVREVKMNNTNDKRKSGRTGIGILDI
jgi:hypothetical protein